MSGTAVEPDLKKEEQLNGNWFSALFHASITGIARYDVTGQFVESNRTYREMIGVSSDNDLKTTNLFDDPVLSAAKSRLCGGEGIRIKTEFDFDTLKATKKIPTIKIGRISCDHVIIPVTHEGKQECLGYLSEIREMPVQDCEEVVKRLNNTLQIVGSVTRHDIQNQLTAVIGYNELLLMMTQDPKFRAFLEKERQAVDKIRRQLAFSKIYQSIGAEPPRWQKIRTIINAAREDINLKSVKVTVDIGEVAVYADPLFVKAVSYLLENSVSHGESVTEVRVWLQDKVPNPVLIVEDNGKGIPEPEKPKIFERGFGKITGWGLFVVREILAVTGMTIAETGQSGVGARFEIQIPAEKFRKE